jgi:arabinosaccharide transport system substrate-binding protein
MDFFYGKAPFALIVCAILSGILLFFSGSSAQKARPDLIYVTFSKEHAEAYRSCIGGFEKKYGVNVQIQLVDSAALTGRLQSAMQIGAEVPDMVELLYPTIGTFTRGPLEDVQLVDLTEQVKSSGLYDQLVNTRFARWSSRGHIFALPHDVHPVMLVYRKDILAQEGVDPSTLTTWDEFCRVGREVVRRNTGPDGLTNRYMLDLPSDGSDTLRLLMLQRGTDLFDAVGHVTFDDEKTLDVVCWYVKQIEGRDRIAFPCGSGQDFSRAMIDGLCLFYFCPDWRTRQIQEDVPSMNGKLGLMPLPAWEPGGIRTSTWGGTGLAITRACRNKDLAWKLAMYLYYDADQLGPRFADTNILPPLKSAWTKPEFLQPRPFFDGNPIGQTYAQLAPQVPCDYCTAYTTLANAKLSEAFTNASLYYESHGDTGLREYAAAELHRCAERVRTIMGRNVFLSESSNLRIRREPTPSPGTPGVGGGDFERKTALDIPNHPHPNPLPEYRERGPEVSP